MEGMIANVDSVSAGLERNITVLADPSAVMQDDGSWIVYFGSASEQQEIGQIYYFRWAP